ncbi:MAG: hypothetical protein L3K23_02170 [Thermoplasmata archaeon]|nr:hypothetical protein [Thermoplasmata archaeon]
MKRKTWVLSATVTIASVLVVAGLLIGGGLLTPWSAGHSVASKSNCSHVGGGTWETTWNNASGSAPTQVWVSGPGYYWATYNNSTYAAESVGWGSPGTLAVAPAGSTLVNMTSETSTAELMMQGVCAASGTTIPWHFDSATQTFVRN